MSFKLYLCIPQLKQSIITFHSIHNSLKLQIHLWFLPFHCSFHISDWQVSFPLSLRYSLNFDNSTTMPAQNFLIIPYGLQNGGPLTALIQNPPHYSSSINWESLSTIFLAFGWTDFASPEWRHGMTRHFSLYWFTNLFSWKDNKWEYLKLTLAPCIWDPNQPVQSL